MAIMVSTRGGSDTVTPENAEPYATAVATLPLAAAPMAGTWIGCCT